jgi:hypothetical protein
MAKTCTRAECGQEAIALLVITSDQGSVAQFCLGHQTNQAQIEILNKFYAQRHAADVCKYHDAIVSAQTQDERTDPIAQGVLLGILKVATFLSDESDRKARP